MKIGIRENKKALEILLGEEIRFVGLFDADHYIDIDLEDGEEIMYSIWELAEMFRAYVLRNLDYTIKTYCTLDAVVAEIKDPRLNLRLEVDKNDEDLQFGIREAYVTIMLAQKIILDNVK